MNINNNNNNTIDIMSFSSTRISNEVEVKETAAQQVLPRPPSSSSSSNSTSCAMINVQKEDEMGDIEESSSNSSSIIIGPDEEDKDDERFETARMTMMPSMENSYDDKNEKDYGQNDVMIREAIVPSSLERCDNDDHDEVAGNDDDDEHDNNNNNNNNNTNNNLIMKKFDEKIQDDLKELEEGHIESLKNQDLHITTTTTPTTTATTTSTTPSSSRVRYTTQFLTALTTTTATATRSGFKIPEVEIEVPDLEQIPCSCLFFMGYELTCFVYSLMGCIFFLTAIVCICLYLTGHLSSYS